MVRRSALLTCVILLVGTSLVPTASSEAVHRGVHYDQIQGYSEGGAHLNVSGWSTAPLDGAAWLLYDLDGDPQHPLATGEYLDEVHPDGEDRWMWTLSIDIAGMDCTCSLMITNEELSSNLIVYLGSPVAWRPVWQKPPTEFVSMIDGVNATLPLDLVLPPGRASGLSAHGLRCPSTSNGVCQGESTTVEVPVVVDGDGPHLDLRWSAWSSHSLWNVSSFVVTDSLLASTDAVAFVLLLDDDAPTVEIDAPQSGFKDNELRILLSTEDLDSGLVAVSDMAVRTPSGVYLQASSMSFDGTTLRFIPRESGSYIISIEVIDHVGHRNEGQSDVFVRNLPPEIDLRLDGRLVVSGEHFVLPASGLFELNASGSTDSVTDVDTLTFVWWIDDNIRIVDRPFLTQSDFQDNGLHTVRVEVVDNDGASTEVAFSLTIEDDQPIPLGEQRWFGSLSLLVGMSVLGLLVLARRTMVQQQIPLWPGVGSEEDGFGATVDRTEA